MDDLTIDDVPDEVVAALMVRAAQHGHSLESEVLAILRDVVLPPQQSAGEAWLDVTDDFRSQGGVEPRASSREAPPTVESD